MQIRTDQLKPCYNYVIIGAGIVGMTILRELIEKGKKDILIIESGSMLSKNPYPEFMSVFSNGNNLKVKSRFSGVGGCSNVWGSICGVFDEKTINSYYKKKQFPLNYTEYKYYLAKCEKYGFPKFDEFNVLKKNNKKFRLKKFIKMTPNLLFNKFSSILESKNVHFLQNKYVDRIFTQNNISKVYFSDPLENKSFFTCRGKKFLLCANTIENYKIIKKSNFNINQEQLGRGFMNHPKGVIGSLKLNKNLTKFLSQKTISKIFWNGIQLNNSEHNHYLKVNKGFKIPFLDLIIKKLHGNLKKYKNEFLLSNHFKSYFTSLVIYFLKIIEKFINLFFKNYINIQAFTEMKKSEKNYINFDRKSNKTFVKYELSNDEVKSLDRLIKEFEKEFNLKILFKPKSFSKLKKIVSIDSSHHMGGLVCGDDKTNSIVDLNLCVHNTKNIFVCGGAIFPFSGVANPTLSYIALAIWLSENI